MFNSQKTKTERTREGYYQEFVEKFKPKLTTDDCMTPEPVYAAVLAWARKEYGIGEDTRIVRPFWPGEDYTQADYSGDCVVIDNPPFSKLASICRYYAEKGLRFFLFAPSLTLFSNGGEGYNYVITDVQIIYENGASIPTSFVTNMGDCKIQIAPELDECLEYAVKIVKGKTNPTKKLPKYDYPANVCTAALLKKIAARKIPLKISAQDTYFIRKLDAQKRKALFGGGFLLSKKAAAEKAAAEKAAAEKAAAEKVGRITYDLSPREIEIVAGLGNSPAKNMKEAEPR